MSDCTGSEGIGINNTSDTIEIVKVKSSTIYCFMSAINPNTVATRATTC